MFKISILSIGDEICIGQIINTNAAWIAQQCTSLGAKVLYHSAIRDDENDVVSELNRLIPLSDMLIITGGLGPTHDDVTKNVLTKYFKSQLFLDKNWEEELESRYKKMGREFTERNREQALMPKGAKLLANKVGTAPGILFNTGKHFIAALPGVPAEMNYIFNHSLKSIISNEIKEKKHSVVLFKVLNVAGIAESDLADLVGNVDGYIDSGTLAFLPSYQGIRLRIGVEDDNYKQAENNIKRVEKELNGRIGKYIVGQNKNKIIQIVADKLTESGKTISVAESCTGGLLGAELTETPGSSDYFIGGCLVYSNEAKEKHLGVKKETLSKYGAVSEHTAKELADNVRLKFKTDYGIGITGIAGPGGGTDEKPIGTVWISLSIEKRNKAQKFIFGSNRNVNRQRAVGAALSLLLEEITENKA